jgi:hypothetical protein
MADVAIKFTQGATTDIAGRAVEGVAGSAVTASAVIVPAVTSYAWYLVDAPEGSVLTVTEVDEDMNPIGAAASTASTFVFTPDAGVKGTYQVLLIVNGIRALFDVRDFVVPEASGNRIPALRSDERTYNLGGQTRGPRADVNAILRKAAAATSGPVATQTVNTTTGNVALARTAWRVVVHKATGATNYRFPTASLVDQDIVDIIRDSAGTGTIALDGGSINIVRGATSALTWGPSSKLNAIRATYFSTGNVWRLS